METVQGDGNILVQQLAETNDKLQQKNEELLEAIRSRDQQIKKLEEENKKMKETIADLRSKNMDSEEEMTNEKLDSLVDAAVSKVSESILGVQKH